MAHQRLGLEGGIQSATASLSSTEREQDRVGEGGEASVEGELEVYVVEKSRDSVQGQNVGGYRIEIKCSARLLNEVPVWSGRDRPHPLPLNSLYIKDTAAHIPPK